MQRSDGQPVNTWAAYRCTTCGSITTGRCVLRKVGTSQGNYIVDIYPDTKVAHADLPPIAKQFLQQAYETLHAPDAAAVMAGSAVDAMLKTLGYEEGSVYARIESAVKANVLTADMGKWAHSVRLGSNRPRHADKERPHVSAPEARQAVEFAEALGNFLFVLKAQVERGIEAAESTTEPEAAAK